MAGAPASEGSPALSETSPRSSDESTLPGVFGLVDTAIARIEAVMLAAGRLVYVGPPDGAPDFFGARDLPAVYRALAEGDAARFARRLEASSLYREHVLDRLEPGR